jgi:predicted nucleic acid-binding protein
MPTSLERHPVVPDANLLFPDVVRYARGDFCALAYLAELGAIALFVPAHVHEMAREKVALIADDMGVDSSLALETWTEVYLPLLRFVHVRSDCLQDDERVLAVEDPEDRPFAQLAILLAPSLLLTRDRHLLRAGIGTSASADALIMLGTILELDAAVHGWAHAAFFVAALLGQVARGTARMITSSPVVVGMFGALVAMTLTEWRGPAGRLAGDVRNGTKTAMARFAEMSTVVFEQRVAIDSELRPNLVQPTVARSAESTAMRVLATQRRPVSTARIALCLRSSGFRIGADELVRWLGEISAFEARSDDTWVLGRSVREVPG